MENSKKRGFREQVKASQSEAEARIVLREAQRLSPGQNFARCMRIAKRKFGEKFEL